MHISKDAMGPELRSFSFRRRKKKGGISELIATVLLLVITIGIGVLILAYATLGFSNSSIGFLNLVSIGSDQLSQQLVVEQTYFHAIPLSSQYSANIYVRNVGTSVATVVTVYVQDQTNASDSLTIQLAPSVQINPGSFEIITFQFSATHGITYAFTVVSSNGDKIITYAKA
ncbi:MAG: hypothetical protein ACYC7D_14895 [Nitrososphaerales archaeon]